MALVLNIIQRLSCKTETKCARDISKDVSVWHYDKGQYMFQQHGVYLGMDIP